MLRLAWRNMWRNKRRAMITVASVFFAVFFCTVMMCYQEGMWDKVIDNTLRTQAGNIQIHAKGYWEDKIIDNFMFADAETVSGLEAIDNVVNVSPRVETFAMASFGNYSKGVAVIGISPKKEKQKSNLPIRLAQGGYLEETDGGILIGEGLSKYLKVEIGDTLALIGQGYHGASAAGIFPVRGILDMFTAEMNSGVIYMTLPSAQQFIDMQDGYSGILISIKDNGKLDETIKKVKQTVDTETMDVLSWHYTMERLIHTAESDRVFNVALMYIMYLIVGFGILGTVIMMTNERRREFCMMISLGMPRVRMASVVAVELIVMSITGVVLAVIVAYPVACWFSLHPIELTGGIAEMYISFGMEATLPMSANPSIFVEQMCYILVISLLAAIYPINKIMKLKIMNRQ